jgi:acyl-coenzyme A synthetase/AMP-(fatty) acid ligase
MFDIVEDAIIQIDGIIECCIVGVPEDPAGNEIPVAMVVSENGRLSESKILSFLKGKFDPTYKLGRVFFVPNLIKTITGKIKRNDIRDLAIKRYHENQ